MGPPPAGITQPTSVAYSRALSALRDAHPHEFTRLLSVERAALGLSPEPPGKGWGFIPLDEEELLAGFAAGITYAEMAAHFGVHPNTIRARLRAHGLRRAHGGRHETPLASLANQG